MNSLIALGTIAAYLTSCIALITPQLGWECFFDEPVMLLGFILLGRTLEYQAKKRAKSSFTSLLSLQPKLARLIINHNDLYNEKNSIEIAANQLKVGELIRILPGEKIPADGEIISGESTINQSMLTGESLPVYKSIGDEISAGTINQSGVIVIRVNRAGKDTTLAQIISFVENAQTRKAPIQKLADIVAGYFTYGVLTISFLTFLFWQFIGTKIWHNLLNIGLEHLHHTEHQSPLLLSLKLAITVLVIACPCALGLATPTAILVGTSIGAEKGLLIKGGDILEKVNQVDTIIFDKTGTLTTGNPIVTDIISWSNLSKEEILKLAYTVESGTRHPLAEAIKQEVHRLELTGYSATNFQTFPGE
ncbi:MAG TPA: heavy metal translocating P-type ATPase, partial [Allocoleopsis sp.]